MSKVFVGTPRTEPIRVLQLPFARLGVIGGRCTRDAMRAAGNAVKVLRRGGYKEHSWRTFREHCRRDSKELRMDA